MAVIEGEMLVVRAVPAGEEPGEERGVAGKRPAARGVGALEANSARREASQVRRGIALVSVGRRVVRAHRVEDHEHEGGLPSPRPASDLRRGCGAAGFGQGGLLSVG